MSHIILHHHIFKNAGTTLDFSLQRHFGDDFATLDDPEEQAVDPGMLYDFLSRRPEVKVVSSHHFHAQDFIRKERYRFFELAFVRRPLSRLLSIYTYSLRSVGERADMAKQSDLRQFVRQLILRHPYMVDNPQVNIFANHGFYGRPTSDDDLRKACNRYGSFALCAPVERYDEAMVTLEYFASPIYGPDGLDLAYVRQNVSPPLEGTNDLPGLLGTPSYEWIMAMSERDEQLWQFANRELDRRIRAVPDFEERLLAFRQKCQQLSAVTQQVINCDTTMTSCSVG